jgi:hypothetical protein
VKVYLLHPAMAIPLKYYKTTQSAEGSILAQIKKHHEIPQLHNKAIASPARKAVE